MNSKTICLFLVIASFLVGCSGSMSRFVDLNNAPLSDFEATENTFDSEMISPATDVVSGEKLYKIITKEFVQEKINIKYPQIQGLGDNIKEEIINNLIQNEIFENMLESEDVTKYLQDSKSNGLDDSLTLELEYDIMMHTDKVLSILYTGTRTFKTAHFWSYDIYTTTIDLEQATVLCLSDFIDINENLIEKLKSSESVTNGAVEGGMDRETLLKAIQGNIKENENFILENLSGEPHSYFTYVVTPESLLISIMIDHASGDYALIEIQYNR